ncbi:MAG TPA: DUF951 domain-containing protein [Anaerolineae bacterium]|nr:DUF951 domain-containing protein [Anaerolineae bacterium]
MPMDLKVGNVVRLRKQHPCGGFEWEIVRIGADIGLRCLKCRRRVLVPRSKIEKRIRKIFSDEEAARVLGQAS